jgi:hypothetical protein
MYNSEKIGFFNGSTVSQSVNAIQLRSWTHIAYVYSGSSLKLYINGVLDSTFSTNPGGVDNANFYIGSLIDDTNTYDNFGGYISNIRILNNTQLYTGNFIPPTSPVTNIANTQLLCNFTNSAIYDSSMMNDSATIGDTKIDTNIVKSLSSSIYFDGNGDNILFPYQAEHNLKGDFTIEMWIYWISSGTGGGFLISKGGVLNIAWASYEIYIDATTSNVRFAASTSNTSYDIGGENNTGNMGIVQKNTWAHIAVTRQGNVFRGFVNGVQGYTQTSAGILYDSNPRGLSIGANYATTWGTNTPVNGFNGYIEDLRITNGIARYTGQFIPPSKLPVE